MTRARGGALVTGAGRGLGQQIAALLADRGHRVMVTDVDAIAARTVANEIGRNASSLGIDVRNHDPVR